MNALYSTLKTIIWVFLLSVSGSLLAESGPKESEKPPPLLKPTASTSSGTSNTACYFNDGGSITWKWGLTSNNSWYVFSGNWIVTQYTKIEKFSTTVNYDDIYQSCVNSKGYYKLSGNLFAIFAATRDSGDNYSILLGGGELFSQY